MSIEQDNSTEATSVDTAPSIPEAVTDNSTESNSDNASKLKVIEDHTDIIKAKRVFHPNDENYLRGQADSQEMFVAKLEFMSLLSDKQLEAYQNGTLVYTVKDTENFLGTIKPGDVLGHMGSMYKVSKVTKKNGVIGNKLKRRKVYRGLSMEWEWNEQETILTKADIDLARQLAFTEILYRDDKVFGHSEDIEMKVRIKLVEDENGKVYVNQKAKEVKTLPESTEPSSNSTESV